MLPAAEGDQVAALVRLGIVVEVDQRVRGEVVGASGRRFLDQAAVEVHENANLFVGHALVGGAAIVTVEVGHTRRRQRILGLLELVALLHATLALLGLPLALQVRRRRRRCGQLLTRRGRRRLEATFTVATEGAPALEVAARAQAEVGEVGVRRVLLLVGRRRHDLEDGLGVRLRQRQR